MSDKKNDDKKIPQNL